MSKKVILVFLIFTLLLIPTAFATDNPQPIKVYVEGEQLSFAEQPFIENDVTLVQFRPIFEKLGLKIEWNADTQTITGRNESTIIKLTIGSTSAVVNDEVKTLVLAPKIVNGSTMVPLRFVSEASGKETKWYGDTKIIQVGKQIDLGGITTSPVPTLTPTTAPQTSKIAFRKTYWGMSLDDVKKSETEGTYLGMDRDLLMYENVTISNINMSVIYEFANGKLVSAGYIDKEKHYTDNAYVSDYNSVKSALTVKYGKTLIEEDMTWLDDLYKNDGSSKYGIAVSTGRLEFLSSWDIGDSSGTSLTLRLAGKDFTSTLIVMYRSKQYEGEAKQNRDVSGGAGL